MKHLPIYVFIISLFNLCNHSVLAGDIRYEKIAIEQGLPSPTVNCIVQDQQGYLWFGTTSGLCRYDGFNVKVYRKQSGIESSLKENSVTSLFVDREGTLWIGTLGSLQKYNRFTDNFTHFHFARDSLFRGYINDIIEDSFGILWISINRDRLVRFDRKKKEFRVIYFATEMDTSNKNTITNDMLITQNDMLWVASKKGLYRHQLPLPFKNKNKAGIVDTVRFIYYNGKLPAGIKNNWTRQLVEDHNHTLWMGTTGGKMMRYDEQKDRFIKYPTDDHKQTTTPPRSIQFINEKDDKRLVIGTKNGLHIFDKSTGHFTDNYFKGMRINTYFRDRSGVEWYGTLYEGVLKVSNENKKFAPPLQYKNKDIFIDEKGVVWIGGPMGLYELNRRSEEIRRYTIIKTDNYSFFNEITAICEDTPAGLWISTMRGLYRFDKESKLFSHPAIRIGTDKWTSLYRDNSGILWLGKEADGDGLYKFDPSSNTVSRFPFDTHTRYKIYKDRITRIYEDSKENLWICTNRGLSKFDRLDNHFTHYFLSEKEVKNHSGEEYTRDVLEPNINSKRFLWVAADSGLYQFDTETGKFSICRLANGQPVNEYISGGLRRIAEDGDGNIWFSCNLGLGKYNPYSKSLHRYFQTDGLQGNTFNTAHFKSNNGEMFFGGPQGVSAFFPVSIKDNPHIPEIVITNMKILNKEARLDSNLSLIRKVIIPHDQNIISIEYAALDFNNPKRNQYIHKLENFDPEWTYTGNKHDVTYTNLDPGEYLFRVKGSNSDGIWNEAGTSLLIIITPPWWQTGPAYTLYILTFALIILATWKVQVNRLHMKHQLEIDHLQTEKLQEVDRIKSHFFANISHEFRTPLTLILSPVEQMLSGEFQGNLKEQYKMIIRNGRRLLLLINQLLDLSKLESGKLKLHAQSTDIIKRTNELVQAFESLAKKNNIALKFMPEIESQLVYVDIEKYETIMNNLLSNAFKFTPEDGEIVVRIGRGEASRSKGIDLFNLSTEEASPLLQSLPSQISNIQHPISNIIKITISNTGSGIPSEKINNIFDRFYQLDDSYTRENEGTGIGLALTKELVELHHGTIEVQCRRGGSQTAPTSDGMYLTTFKVKIPTGKEHLSAGEIAEEVDSLIPNPGSRIVQSDIQFEPQGSSIEHRESKIPSPLILIVEDNPDLRQYICSNLDKHYQVIEAENGEQGFSKATSAIPDLIISDVMMPGMDGFELCSRIKTDERTSHIPLILLTARADQEDKLEGLEIGADDYIIKPFDKKELNIRIKNLLTQRLSLMMRFRSEIGLTAEDIAPTSRDKHITCQILHIVYQHMSDPKFNLEILACELGISQMSLYRKINGLFGQSPGDFVRTIRLKHGAKLLKNNSGNISEIAYEVGFSNPANFSSSFRRQFGMSPRDYLKSIDAT